MSADVIVSNGERMYRKLRSELERKHRDGYVAIAIEHGDYAVGADRNEAMALFSARFGNAPGYLRKIGALDRVGHVRV